MSRNSICFPRLFLHEHYFLLFPFNCSYDFFGLSLSELAGLHNIMHMARESCRSRYDTFLYIFGGGGGGGGGGGSCSECALYPVGCG